LAEDGGLPVELVAADYQGADTIVTARIGSQSLLVRIAGRVTIDGSRQARLKWPPEAIRVFDAATGQVVADRRPAASAA
jgi:sn-glycerol 3-phosphate transport system ATP-binding protein